MGYFGEVRESVFHSFFTPLCSHPLPRAWLWAWNLTMCVWSCLGAGLGQVMGERVLGWGRLADCEIWGGNPRNTGRLQLGAAGSEELLQVCTT